MGFSRQEYWRGLPCPSPGDLPGPGIEPRSCCWPKSWPPLPTKAEWKIRRHSLEEIEMWLLFSAGREGNPVGSCLKNCAPLHEESRGFYRASACSQAMRNKGDRTLTASSCIVSKTIINRVSNPVIESGSFVFLWPSFWSVTTRGKVL